MFGFFKNRKRTKTAGKIAQVFYAALFSLLDTNTGRLPAKLRDDVFVLAYVYGVLGFMSVRSEINDRTQLGFLVLDVYERLFPGYGRVITEKCNQLILNKDTLFLSVLETAQSEIEAIYRVGGHTTLVSLQAHINKYYRHDS